MTALVPAASIYPQASGEPQWPFIKLGPTGTLRLRAACVNGGLVSLDVHAFARARVSGGQEVETAEDHASRIGAAIEAALDGVNIALEGGAKAKIDLGDIRLLQDQEPDAFHWFAQLNARVLAA
ncbi:tail terminator protein [Synechococcus phage Yong-M3-232]|nr:tail terminator protein [Synechococcus phage Yong-M3-232]